LFERCARARDIYATPLYAAYAAADARRRCRFAAATFSPTIFDFIFRLIASMLIFDYAGFLFIEALADTASFSRRRTPERFIISPLFRCHY
jgi:hypothetical protein